jgi:two-component SAPR family response regulator
MARRPRSGYAGSFLPKPFTSEKLVTAVNALQPRPEVLEGFGHSDGWM